jgi:DNA-binding FadR family transcriptional regulator
VSRSTVREALRLLASQHLVVTTRGVTGGSFVAEPTPGQLGALLTTGLQLLHTSGTVKTEHWLEVRETFEVPAAGLAALQRTSAHLERLEATLHKPDHADVEKMLAAHLDFHLTLAQATGNPLYEVIIQPLYKVANERAVSRRIPPGMWRRLDTEHRMILRAVAAGDAAAARAAARIHVEQLRSGYEDMKAGRL